MRIERLDLVRYGHFTDHHIDLARPGPACGGVDDEPPEARPDLHLVYGPNEAGKSTLLAAIVDLLFGMPRRSRYGFVHDYSTLHISASLAGNGQSRVVHRYKNHLSDAQGQRLAESALDTQGLDREQFLNRFSFDDETLQQGGEEILQSRGDLGQTLFSASSGLADVHQRLEQAMSAGRTFYDRGKSKGLIMTDLIERLKAIDEELKAIDLNAAHYRRQQRQAAEARTLYDTLNDTLREHDTRIDLLKRQRACLERRRQWQQHRAERERVADARRLPIEWQKTLSETIPIDAELRGRRRTLDEQHRSLQERLAALPPDDPILQQGAIIDRLHLDATRQQTQHSELIAEQATLSDTAADIGRLLQSLAPPQEADPATLRLPHSLFDSLEDDLAAGRKLQARNQSVTDELAVARLDREALPAAPDIDTVPGRLLDNLTEVLEERGLSQRRQDAKRTADELRSALHTAVAELAPYDGDPLQLAALRVPEPAWLDDFDNRLQQADTRLDTTTQRCRELADEVQRREQETGVRELSLAEDERAAQDARQQRDAAWQTHVEQLGQPTVDASRLAESARVFAGAMADDDRQLARRLQQADERSERRQASAELTRARAAKAREEESRDLAREQRQTLQTTLAAEIAACGLPPHTDTARLRSWLTRRQQYLQRLSEQQRLDRELATLDTEVDRHCQRLRQLLTACLGDAPPPDLAAAGLDELMSLARRCREAIRQQSRDSERQRERQALLQARENTLQQQLEQSATALAAWRKGVDAVLADTWLATLGAAGVDARLPELRQLNRALWTQAESAARAHSRQQDVVRFIAEVAALDPTVERKPDTLDAALAQLELCRSTLEQARERYAERRRLQQAIADTVSATADLEQEHHPIRERLQHMLDDTGSPSLEALAVALERSAERQRLELGIERLEHELIEALGVDTAEQALAQLADLEPASLDGELATLEDRRAGDRTLAQERHHAWRLLADPLDSLAATATAARLREERATVLLTLEEGALDCLRTRLGQQVISEALRRFRDQHRSEMMRQARDAFVTMTHGQFTDLQSQPDARGNDQLVAVRDDGSSLLADRMSRGTRLQLYLALRVAAYHDYRQHRPPLPFVADDIMETFDDRRSAAAFELLAGMARHGQVIYLTHHRHLIDIAREVIGPSLTVHELPSRALVRGSSA